MIEEMIKTAHVAPITPESVAYFYAAQSRVEEIQDVLNLIKYHQWVTGDEP